MSPNVPPHPPTVASPSIIPEYPEVNWGNIIGHPVKKRSVVIRDHKTSLSIEEPFWSRLLKFAARHECPVSDVVTLIDDRGPKNLSSAVRMFILLLDDQETEIARQQTHIGKLEARINRLKTQNAKLRGIADIAADDGEEARP